MKREIKAERIADYLAAGYAGFIIKTSEPKRADSVLSAILRSVERKDGNKYNVVSWDVDSANEQNPLKPLVDLTETAPELTVAFLHNYHWFLDKPPAIQKIQNCMDIWSNQGKAIIILTPKPDIPVEIRKDFMLLEMPLPDEPEIRECMFHISKSVNAPELLQGDNTQIVQAAKGLTKTEIENVLALSFTVTDKFDINVLNEQKIQAIEKSGLIEVLRTDQNYSNILGYDRMKTIISKVISKRSAKGVLIVGPPGCGKTKFIECTVGQFSKIGIIVNFGRLYSKYQGEGTANVEEIINIIEAIGDCIVIIDEFEKQFAGAASTGDTDSGTSRRMTGRWLQFMSEKPEGVYLMGTCNSFKGIPDEYLRPGRWDSSPFYVDLPNEQEKELILDYYINKLNLEKLLGSKQLRPPDMPNWTGAEIEACCEMASNLECSLTEASGFIIPQNKQGFKEANALKQFAIPATSLEYSDGTTSKKKNRMIDKSK